MNPFAIGAFITGLSSAFFGTFVYLKNRKRLENQIFGVMNFSLTVWAINFGFWQLSTDKATAFLFVRLLMTGAIFIPIFYLHFILVFLDLNEKKRKFLIWGYLITFIFLFFNFTPYIVKDLRPVLYFPYWPEGGMLFHFWLLWFLIALSYGLFLLMRKMKELIGIEKERIKYVILAAFLSFFGGLTIFPLWYKIPCPPIGIFVVGLYPIILAFAILRYHLFEIRVLLTELLVVAMGIVLIILPFLMRTFKLRIFTTSIFILFCILGYLLIKTTYQEMERREKLQVAYEELKRLDIAKSEFISITSHQLRTPLSAIKGYLSMILEGVYGEVSEKVKKVLENIYLANERLIKLVNSFLNVSKIELGKLELELERADIVEIVESVVKEMEIAVKGKNLYLKFEKPKEVPKILIDKEKIREIILNLVDNAIKYTQRGGVEVKLQIVNNRLQIVVADTGEGLTKEEKAKLFESFSRGSAGQKYWVEGAGIGLYVAKKIVELHQGKIWVESEGKGKGSKFYVELPIK
jgi:signal transduction histidine kinase